MAETVAVELTDEETSSLLVQLQRLRENEELMKLVKQAATRPGAEGRLVATLTFSNKRIPLPESES